MENKGVGNLRVLNHTGNEKESKMFEISHLEINMFGNSQSGLILVW